MCDTLSKSLGRDFGAAAIHGDKSQQERESVLSEFKSGRKPVLVATDVAARGLDVKDVRLKKFSSICRFVVLFCLNRNHR